MKANPYSHSRWREEVVGVSPGECSKTSAFALMTPVSISAALRVVRIFVMTGDLISSREFRALIANRTARIDQILSMQRG